MTALTELRDKVAMGEFFGDMPRPYVLHTDLCWKAFNGSLDAAKVLHEALLPEWGYELTHYPEAHLYPPKDLLRIGPVYADDGHGGELSRAWLLTILDALIAKEADDADQ